MEQTRSELKDKFQDGDIPTGTDFANLIDSFLNFEDDGMTSYKSDLPGPFFRRFGIGDTAPACPLGIKGEDDGYDGMICFTSNDGTTKWNINLNTSPSDMPGFAIDDISSGSGMNRFFIQPTTGYIGIGTFAPQNLLHIEGNVSNGYVSAEIHNVGTFNDHGGFLLSHFSGDSLTDPRDGTFAIVENTAGGSAERITVLPEFASGGVNVFNVGINEMMPMCSFHVSRNPLDPKIDINLNENTGILLLGPIEGQNLGFDRSNIQARTGVLLPGTSTLSFTATTLGLQPRGGDIVIHSGSSTDKRINITDIGTIGVGKTPIESVDVNGAITIANSPNPSASANGTIRWTGTDFEGRVGGTWVSLTKGSFTDGIWTQPGGANTNLIYFNPSSPGLTLHPKVGIGTDTPTKTFQVYDNENVDNTNSIAVLITTEATISGDSLSVHARVGLNVQNNSAWSTNPDALDVGIYVSNVEGQTNLESNIAAAFNGNIVVGGVSGGASVIGANGRNVLAVQSGDFPTSAPGTTTMGGIQIYSRDLSLTSGVPDVSVTHVMNGDGTVMRFYQQSLTTANNPNNPNTGNPSTDQIIADTRQRVLELENVLKNLGLLL